MATPTGALGAEKNYLLLLAAAGVLLFLSIAGFFTYQSSVARDQSLLSSSRLLVDTLKSLSKTGSDAATGVPPDFELVQSLTKGFQDTLLAYESGNSELGITELASDAKPQLEALNAAWAPMRDALKVIEDNAVPYGRVSTNIKAIADVVPPAIGAYAEALEVVSRGKNAADTYAVSRQLMRL